MKWFDALAVKYQEENMPRSADSSAGTYVSYLSIRDWPTLDYGNYKMKSAACSSTLWSS